MVNRHLWSLLVECGGKLMVCMRDERLEEYDEWLNERDCIAAKLCWVPHWDCTMWTE